LPLGLKVNSDNTPAMCIQTHPKRQIAYNRCDIVKRKNGCNAVSNDDLIHAVCVTTYLSKIKNIRVKDQACSGTFALFVLFFFKLCFFSFIFCGLTDSIWELNMNLRKVLMQLKLKAKRSSCNDELKFKTKEKKKVRPFYIKKSYFYWNIFFFFIFHQIKPWCPS